VSLEPHPARVVEQSVEPELAPREVEAADVAAAAVRGTPPLGAFGRLRVEGPCQRTSGWSSKASEAELKGVEVCRD
jgi:hypothetical protein